MGFILQETKILNGRPLPSHGLDGVLRPLDPQGKKDTKEEKMGYQTPTLFQSGKKKPKGITAPDKKKG